MPPDRPQLEHAPHNDATTLGPDTGMKHCLSPSPRPDATLLDEFLVNVRRQPSAPAVQDGLGYWSYQQLYGVAAAVAQRLWAIERSGNVVLVVAGRSRIGVAAAVGTVLSGFACGCLEPSVPERFLADIVGRLRPHAVLLADAGPEMARRIVGLGLQSMRVVRLDSCLARHADSSAQVLSPSVQGSDPAYVCFTSGTTGSPKAVAVSHAAAVESFRRYLNDFGFRADDRIGFQSEFSFDLAMFDIFATLMVGAAIVVIPSGLFRRGLAYLAFLKEHGVTSLYTVAALVAVVLGELPFQKRLQLRRLIICGERLRPPILRLLVHNVSRSTAIYNLYGGTEMPYVLAARLEPLRPQEANSFPWPSDVDVRLRPCGGAMMEKVAGAGGELLVRSTGLFAGYWTEEGEWIPRPDVSGYYPTGDMFDFVNGCLHFNRRQDRQIKHYGYRIELDELEWVVEELPGVVNCVAIHNAEIDTLSLQVFIKEKATAHDKKIVSHLDKYLPHIAEHIDYIEIYNQSKKKERVSEQKIR